MANPKEEKPQDDRPLDHRVKDWLSNQGYRLEYQACNAFNVGGVNARLGVYLESTGEVPREIDVLATKGHPKGACVQVVCECKYSAERPWVLLAPEGSELVVSGIGPVPRSQALGTAQFDSEFHRAAGHRNARNEIWHLKQMGFYHSLLQAFRTDKANEKPDLAYAALRKAANAAWDLAEKDESRKMIVFPCLIVDAPLFRAGFTPTEGFSVQSIPFGRLLWLGCRDGTLVDVVTVDALPAYVENLNKAIAFFLDLMHAGT